MKKILLIGKRGFLGNYLNRFLRKKFIEIKKPNEFSQSRNGENPCP